MLEQLELERPAAADGRPAFNAPQDMAVDPGDTQEQIAAACARVTPLWPLKNFVAVNPFVGLSDTPFAEACDLLGRVTHGSMHMPPAYYAAQWQEQQITRADLSWALGQAGHMPLDAHTGSVGTITPEALVAALDQEWEAPLTPLLTVADAVDAHHGTRWTAFVVDEISKWCSAYYDEGQASWRMPWRNESLLAAWKQAAQRDANPEVMGLHGFRKMAAALPDDAGQAIAALLRTLHVPDAIAVDFLHRTLMSVKGWSGYVQYQVREHGLYGKTDNSLQHLLAIRLAYDAALFQQQAQPGFQSAWANNVAAPMANGEPAGSPVPYLWQLAAEHAYQRGLLAKIAAGRKRDAAPARPTVQAVFCIDVRSEVLRRSLEAMSPEIETIGFAGFFGFPIEYVPFGGRHGTVQCPVLLTPAFRIQESILGAPKAQAEAALQRSLFTRRLGRAWNAFKTSAVSCFSFVETGGLLSGWKLITDSLGLHHHTSSAFGPRIAQEAAPHVAAVPAHHPHHTGMSVEEQVATAANALTHMGLTRNLARLVVICGHGSSTTNNPYAAGLDCGACGGHSGEANARVAAAVLNNAPVREALRARGITIPDDTHFVAALHNTTTDAVTLFDTHALPASHAADLANLQQWLHGASEATRLERAPSLGLAQAPPSIVEKQVQHRSADWSQTRPEWGLAGNAAFVAAPRARTQGMDLGGRAFLNNYDYRTDVDGSKLNLVMTAPLVVASWINLQYFASTVNNAQFGSGNKTLHNVVGTIGVWEGNCGDLQVGLPLQSVHNGRTWMHEPLRLSALIEAPREMIESVLAANPSVRQLVDNGWVHLIAIEDNGRTCVRYCGEAGWEDTAPAMA